MGVDEAIAIVESKARGRTRYDGQNPFIDEVFVDEIKRLRSALGKIVSHAEANGMHDWKITKIARDALK